MAKLFNLARMTTATAGTGTLTLGAAVSGYLTFAQAGVSNGDIVDYAVKDGNNSEHGRGVYTSSGTTLTRSVVNSTNSNAAINLSGTAEVFISPLADTLQVQVSPTVFTSSGTFTTPSDSTPLTVYRFRMVGAGGGGGGANGTAAAGGGGAGAYAEGTFTGVAPNTGITITVGGAGSGGANTGGTGTTGGNSAIGAPVNVTCGGGGPGNGITASVSLPGSGGGVTGTPNILSMNGQRGEPGVQTITANIVRGGRGADSPLGQGGEPGMGSIATSGQPGSGYGTGGGGGAGNGGFGGAGRPGIVIIERISG